jgi:hypothetical protein
MHGIQSEDTDQQLDPAAATPFRAAFAEARRETRRTPAVAADADQAVHEWDGTWFEVRIQKRLGTRSAETSRWNKLGRKGWELVAVDGKHAFFRRRHGARGSRS